MTNVVVVGLFCSLFNFMCVLLDGTANIQKHTLPSLSVLKENSRTGLFYFLVVIRLKITKKFVVVVVYFFLYKYVLCSVVIKCNLHLWGRKEIQSERKKTAACCRFTMIPWLHFQSTSQFRFIDGIFIEK